MIWFADNVLIIIHIQKIETEGKNEFKKKVDSFLSHDKNQIYWEIILEIELKHRITSMERNYKFLTIKAL